MTRFALIQSRPPATIAVARAIIDASCASIVAGDHVDEHEVDYAIGVAERLRTPDC